MGCSLHLLRLHFTLPLAGGLEISQIHLHDSAYGPKPEIQPGGGLAEQLSYMIRWGQGQNFLEDV